MAENIFYFLSYLILYFLIILFIIICVAMFTLLERKVLAAIQRRRGPNVVGFWGILQPFADALKSLFKEVNIPSGSNHYIFLGSPVVALILSLMPWSVICFSSKFVIADINAGVLFILFISSLGVYPIVLAGWSSNSKYALLGGLRSAAQMISYEIPLALCIVPVVMLASSFNLTEIVFAQKESCWFVLPLLPCFIIFLVSALAETNRTPFDLPEAEAEIVAGYNVEYSSIHFAMFFLAEYGNIMSISAFGSILFLGGWTIPFGLDFLFLNHEMALVLLEVFFLFLKMLFFMLFFIFIRSVLPRYRYDQLMDINWKIFIPFLLFFIMFCAFVFVAISISATISTF